jgi:triosephosphate isomerase (TIM)
MKQRPTVITGNWKMNKTLAETRSFISGLGLVIAQSSFKVGLAVPFTGLFAAADAALETPIQIGAQNMSEFNAGAYTGEISCEMIKDAGASFVLLGHSERRHLFHEDNALINRKIKKALEFGVKPVFCIGETLAEHQSGKTQAVLSDQMAIGLDGITASQMKSLTLAYEPVWAIGTNQAATPEIAQETHAFCRQFLAKKWGQKVAEEMVIQYGGSVNPSNARDLLEQPDIDGLLIGGASLSLDSFSKIILVHV